MLTVGSDDQSRRLLGDTGAPPLLQSNSANPIAFCAELDHRASLAYLRPRGAGCIDEQCIQNRASWTDHHVDVLERWKPAFDNCIAYLEADVWCRRGACIQQRVQQSEPCEAGHTRHLDLVSGERVAREMCLVHDQDTQAAAG